MGGRAPWIRPCINLFTECRPVKISYRFSWMTISGFDFDSVFYYLLAAT